MKASEWIDRVKTEKGLTSDYSVAAMLGITRSTVSKYRSKTPTLDEDTAEKVAAVLKINPAGIVIDQAAERAKNPATRAALLSVADQLCILCKVSIAGLFEAAHRVASSVAA